MKLPLGRLLFVRSDSAGGASPYYCFCLEAAARLRAGPCSASLPLLVHTDSEVAVGHRRGERWFRRMQQRASSRASRLRLHLVLDAPLPDDSVGVSAVHGMPSPPHGRVHRHRADLVIGSAPTPRSPDSGNSQRR
jgi:hypothetical protein